MDQAELNHLQEQIEHLARRRFPTRPCNGWWCGSTATNPPSSRANAGPPGPEPRDQRRPDGTDADALVIEEFHRSQGAAIQGFRHDLQTVPQVAMVSS